MAETDNKLKVRYAFGTSQAFEALSKITPGKLYFLKDSHTLWLDTPDGERIQIYTNDMPDIEALSIEELQSLLED